MKRNIGCVVVTAVAALALGLNGRPRCMPDVRDETFSSPEIDKVSGWCDTDRPTTLPIA
jgi:deoxycytidylate deaminase